jgi:hypothetical protein
LLLHCSRNQGKYRLLSVEFSTAKHFSCRAKQWHSMKQSVLSYNSKMFYSIARVVVSSYIMTVDLRSIYTYDFIVRFALRFRSFLGIWKLTRLKCIFRNNVKRIGLENATQNAPWNRTCKWPFRWKRTFFACFQTNPIL